MEKVNLEYSSTNGVLSPGALGFLIILLLFLFFGEGAIEPAQARTFLIVYLLLLS